VGAAPPPPGPPGSLAVARSGRPRSAQAPGSAQMAASSASAAR
jgi:hypothetical protein